MKEIMEHYGSGLLEMAGGLGVFVIWIKLFEHAGMLHEICLRHLQAICG